MTAGGSALLERLVPDVGTTDTPAHRWLRDHGLPSPRDEAWRYTPLDRLLLGSWQPGDAVPADRAAIDRMAGAHGGPRLVFVDGAFAVGLSDLDGLPHGVGSRHGGSSSGAARPARYDGFQAANEAARTGAAVLHVAADTCVADVAVHVVHLTTGAVSHPRTIVELEPGARLTLIESYAGTASGSLTNASTTLALGDGAHLTHHRLVTGPIGAAHVGHVAVTQDTAAELRSWSLLAGIGTARHAIDVVLRGERAIADLEGLDLPVGNQEHDTAVTVEHAASHDTSRQHFKGVVDGRARTSFGGHVIVAAGTVGSDAGQTNRSLLLQPTARADTRPWLEIFADDVRCSHGATVGRLDDDALFFLRSRGIRRDDARRMLVGAFAAELIESLHLPTLRSFVEATVADVLAGEPRS